MAIDDPKCKACRLYLNEQRRQRVKRATLDKAAMISKLKKARLLPCTEGLLSRVGFRYSLN